MFAEVSTELVAKEVTSYMASFLLDKGGSNLFKNIKRKRERQKFKKQETDFFKYHFREVNDENEREIIFDFLERKVTLENLWYSHEDEISVEQQDLMWLAFQNYKKRESGDSYAPLTYKKKLITCINFHNKLVNKLIINESAHFVIKTFQSKQKEMEESVKRTVREAVKETVGDTMRSASKKKVTTNRDANLCYENESSRPRINRIKICSNWVMYTFSVGVLPFIIKYLSGFIYGRKLIFHDYYTEIFFMTIVFLINAIKNFSNSDNRFAEFAEKLAIFVLILSASAYGSILAIQADGFSSYLKISITFLYFSCIFDILSIVQIVKTN